MKKLFATIAGLALIVSVHAQDTDLPNTVIKDVVNGKKLPFNETITKGRVTLISFWATWCVPCKKEIKSVREKMADWKKDADFDYMTVSIDESRAEGLVRSYAKSQGWDFEYYIDNNGDLKRSLGFQNVPFTMIIDKDGKVVYTHTGYEEGSENEVYAKVKELAGK